MSRPLLVVLRPLGLGDFLTGVPAYRAIARRFPTHRRVLAVPRALHPLVGMTRAFDAACDVEPLTPLPRELFGADIAIDLHGKGPASHHILLASEPRRLIAFANPEIPQSIGGARWRAGEREVRRWCRMLDEAGVPADPNDLSLDAPSSSSDAKCAGDAFEGATIVHPGAASEARRWPLERWIAVVRALQHRGHRIVLTGSASEAHLTAVIARATQPASTMDLGGRTDLATLATIVARASLVLSTDTGIAHFAATFRRPSVTIFGPTSPAAWGPPATGRHHVLWAGTTGDPHATTVDSGLLQIGVDDVLEAIDRATRVSRIERGRDGV